MSSDVWPSRPARVALWAGIVAVFTVWLGRADLFNPDETRAAEIAREMLEDGRFLDLSIYGTPYYDKPAFFYWLLAASMKLFGQTAAAARLPSVVAAITTIGAMHWWARRAYGASVAAVSAGFLASTLFVVALGRFVVIDMTLTAALSCALAWLGAWILDPPDNRRSTTPFFVAVGIGCLVKGPIALVLAGLVTVSALLALRRASDLVALRPLRGLVVVTLVAGPWYAATWWAHPEYIEAFLVQHNVARYAVADATAHQQSWFYLPVLVPVVLLPWGLALPSALRASWRQRLHNPADVYAWTWAAAVVLFFSASQTGLATYILPGLAPLTVFLAAHLTPVLRGQAALTRPTAAAFAMWSLLAAVMAAAVAGALAMGQEAFRWQALWAIPSILAAALAWRAWSTGDGSRLLGGAGLAGIGLVLVVYGGAGDWINAHHSQKSAVAAARTITGKTGRVIAYGITPHSLAFYGRHRVIRSGDPEYAVRMLRRHPNNLLLTKEKRLDTLGLTPLPEGLHVIWRNASSHLLIAAVR